MFVTITQQNYALFLRFLGQQLQQGCFADIFLAYDHHFYTVNVFKAAVKVIN
jgi:hypothetical protein